MSTNAIPPQKRRRALNNRAALQFLRDKAITDGHDGWLDFNGYPALSAQLCWEKSRAWKAVQAWKRHNRAEVNFDAASGRVSIRVLADRGHLERGNGSGISTEKERGKCRGNTDVASVEEVLAAVMEGIRDSCTISTASSEAAEAAEAPRTAPDRPVCKPLETPLIAVPETTAVTTTTVPPSAPMETPPATAAGHLPRYDRDNGTHDVVGDAGAAAGIDAAVVVAAMALSAVAAYFSVGGLVVAFPAEPQAIVAMGVAFEVAKFLGVACLAANWGPTPGPWRLIITLLLLNVAVINAAGVYSRLVADHLGEAGARAASYTAQDAREAAKAEVAAARLADLDRRIALIDAAAEAAARRGRSNAAINAIDRERNIRAALGAERQQMAETVASLRAGRVGMAAREKEAETSLTPIRYAAELLGFDDPEHVVRWLTAMIVMACDPLALAMTAAVASRRRRRWGKE